MWVLQKFCQLRFFWQCFVTFRPSMNFLLVITSVAGPNNCISVICSRSNSLGQPAQLAGSAHQHLSPYQVHIEAELRIRLVLAALPQKFHPQGCTIPPATQATTWVFLLTGFHGNLTAYLKAKGPVFFCTVPKLIFYC